MEKDDVWSGSSGTATARLSGNEQLGLVIVRHSNIVALGPIGIAAAIAPTIREGLQVMENYTRLHITYMRVKLSSKLSGLSVAFHFLEDTGEAKRFHTETAMMLVQHYIETLTGQPLETAEFRFSINSPITPMNTPGGYIAQPTSAGPRPLWNYLLQYWIYHHPTSMPRCGKTPPGTWPSESRPSKEKRISSIQNTWRHCCAPAIRPSLIWPLWPGDCICLKERSIAACKTRGQAFDRSRERYWEFGLASIFWRLTTVWKRLAQP